MCVITISRKLGSMGTYIGRKLAEELGYTYIDKNHLSAIMRDYGFSKFDYIYETVPTVWEKFDEYRENTIKFLAEVIVAVAQQGNVVIAGRGSFGLLDTFSDVINIRIKAPDEFRIHSIMQDRGISEKEAEALMRANDRVRKAFVESDLRFNYTDSTEFDLILDTSIIHPDVCIEVLKTAILEKKGIRDDKRPKVTDLTIEPVLRKHIADMILYFSSQKEEIKHKTEL